MKSTKKIKGGVEEGLICSWGSGGTNRSSLCFSPISLSACLPGQPLAHSCCQLAFLQPVLLLGCPGTSCKASAWPRQESDAFDGAAGSPQSSAAGEGGGRGKKTVADFLEPQSPPSPPSRNCSHKSHLPLTESACLLSLPPPTLSRRP